MIKWAGITNPQRLMRTALTAFICLKALEGMTQITECFQAIIYSYPLGYLHVFCFSSLKGYLQCESCRMFMLIL